MAVWAATWPDANDRGLMQFPGRNTYAAVYPVVNGCFQPEGTAMPGKALRNMRWHILRLFPRE